LNLFAGHQTYFLDAGSGGKEARSIKVGMAGFELVRTDGHERTGKQPLGRQIPRSASAFFDIGSPTPYFHYGILTAGSGAVGFGINPCGAPRTIANMVAKTMIVTASTRIGRNIK
jgi:hypothetical protein